MRTWVGTAGALALVIALGGCTTGTGPGPVENEYALALVGGTPPPVRVGLETWIADTIRFHEGGDWSRVSIVRLHAEGASPGPVRRTMDGFVTERGDRIVLDFECNDVIVLASCIAPDTVRLVGEQLVLQAPSYSGLDELPTFRYDPVTD